MIGKQRTMELATSFDAQERLELYDFFRRRLKGHEERARIHGLMETAT